MINSIVTNPRTSTMGKCTLQQYDINLVLSMKVEPSLNNELQNVKGVSRACLCYDGAQLVKEVGRYGTKLNEFRFPSAVICLPSGNILVSDQDNSRLQLLDNNLKRIRTIGKHGEGRTQFKYPHGLGTDSQGRLFVGDYGNHRIQVMDEQFRFVYTIGEGGAGLRQFECPKDIAINQQTNLLYVCDHHHDSVQVLTTDGTSAKIFCEKGPEPNQLLSKPDYISINNEYQVIVSDIEGNLYVFDQSGELLKRILGKQEGNFTSAAGTFSDDVGNLLVADKDGGGVYVLDRNYSVTCKIGQGTLYQPRAITLTRTGDLFICEWGRPLKMFKYVIPYTTHLS